MKISIIIPVYNASKWLRTCLDSIVGQDFDDYEVLLVDDGSNDGSGGICDEYAGADSRFKVFHKSNGGVSSARNLGLDNAEGDYVMFADADDALLPGALRAMSEAAGETDFVLAGHIVCSGALGKPGRVSCDSDVSVVSENTGDVSANCVLGADMEVVDAVLPETGKSYGHMKDFWADNLKRNCPMLDAPWGKLFKRTLIGDLRFCEQLHYAEDKLFVFNYLAGCTTALTLKRPVYGYAVREGSLGSDICSDRHLVQLKIFLPMYSEVIGRLVASCPESDVEVLYHQDLVGRYVCRILNIFMTRRTGMLTEEYLDLLYDLMSLDKRLGIFSLRPGQIFNILLYKFGNVSFSIKIYGFLSRFIFRG